MLLNVGDIKQARASAVGLSWDRAVTSPGPSIRDDVELSWYMNRGESEGEQLHLLLPDPWVVNGAKLLVGEDGDERQVIHGQDEVSQTKQEKPALVSSPGGSLCFALDWGIILLCLVTEPAPHIDSLPTRGTAARLGTTTATSFLAQPEAHAKFTPVSS